ncbi:MAG TPA: hypothetical protein VIY51_24765 [Xanthobacteraceae bacterium]
MRGNKPFAALSIITALSVLAGSAPALAQDNGRNSGRERGGWVKPCSLDGVNPAYHPEIFGSPTVARSYGFALGPDRAWHVLPGCRR